MRRSIILAIVLSCITLVASAQMHFGIRAGIGFPNQTAKLGSLSMTSERTFGFHAGVVGLFQLPLGFADLELEGDLLFAKLGGKSTSTIVKSTMTTNTSLYYLQVPIRANLFFNFAGFGIYGGLGPKFGFGLAGSQSTKISGEVRGEKMGTSSTDNKIKFGSGNDADYKVMDVALSFHAGVRLGVIPLDASFYYDLGLANIIPESLAKGKNHNLGLSLAYYF